MYDLIIKNGKILGGTGSDAYCADADTIADRSAFTSCHERAVGLPYVLVNGVIAAENAVYNGARAGCLLI